MRRAPDVIRREGEDFYTGPRTEPAEDTDPAGYVSAAATYTDELRRQLGEMALLNDEMRSCCEYLVACLNTMGYLDCTLKELAQEAGVSEGYLEQALFIIQSLEPLGTGARDLTECLLLQLAQSRDFNETNIRAAKAGLPLIADNDIAGLAKLLHVTRDGAKQAADVIRSLNPIPSRGFDSGVPMQMIIPEMTLSVDGKSILVTMNHRGLPRVRLSDTYCALIGDPQYADAQTYLKEKQAEAETLIANCKNREDTLFSLMTAVVQRQEGYFLHGAPLQPMAMGDVARQMGCHVSTVSRAVKDKYVQFQGKLFALRDLFSVPLRMEDGQSASAGGIQRHLQRFVAAEDPKEPLSDQALCHALAGVGVTVSRRTVANYRNELGIPTCARRKRP